MQADIVVLVSSPVQLPPEQMGVVHVRVCLPPQNPSLRQALVVQVSDPQAIPFRLGREHPCDWGTERLSPQVPPAHTGCVHVRDCVPVASQVDE